MNEHTWNIKLESACNGIAMEDGLTSPKDGHIHCPAWPGGAVQPKTARVKPRSHKGVGSRPSLLPRWGKKALSGATEARRGATKRCSKKKDSSASNGTATCAGGLPGP